MPQTLFGSSQTWLFAIFTLFCALLCSFAFFCGLAFALFCAHSRSFRVRPRLERAGCAVWELQIPVTFMEVLAALILSLRLLVLLSASHDILLIVVCLLAFILMSSPSFFPHPHPRRQHINNERAPPTEMSTQVIR